MVNSESFILECTLANKLCLAYNYKGRWFEWLAPQHQPTSSLRASRMENLAIHIKLPKSVTTSSLNAPFISLIQYPAQIIETSEAQTLKAHTESSFSISSITINFVPLYAKLPKTKTSELCVSDIFNSPENPTHLCIRRKLV